MKKLSQQFLELSQHTAALENHAEATRAENRKEFEVHASEAQARVQTFQDAFAARLGNAEDTLAQSWREVDAAFTAQITRVQLSVEYAFRG